MAKEDYYELLGVARDADAAALKKAFRKLAMQYHPDRNPGDEEAEKKFKQLGEAYDVLKDPEKRAAYDRFGHAAFEGGAGPGGAARGAGGFDFSDVFDEFFGDIMGGGGRRGGQQRAGRGADLRVKMEITLEEAFAGVKKTVRVPTAVTCDTCDGTGAAPGSSPKVCDTCGGAGKVRASQGFFMVERTCPTCHGAGHIITDPCRACHGAGMIEKTVTHDIQIPKGVDDGTRLRLGGKGEAGPNGAAPGDLYVFISVAPHNFFKRDGDMLFCSVPIAMTTAALGGQIEVPTIGGSRIRVKVPEGTQTGRQFRLRGKGMPQLQGSLVGDMIIETAVETPVGLSSKQRDLLTEFADDAGDSVSPRSQGFFQKVKEFWDDLTE